MVWNTRYYDAVGAHLGGFTDAIWSHISPISWEHILFVGNYSFEALRLSGELRPLRLHNDFEPITTPGSRSLSGTLDFVSRKLTTGQLGTKGINRAGGRLGGLAGGRQGTTSRTPTTRWDIDVLSAYRR